MRPNRDLSVFTDHRVSKRGLANNGKNENKNLELQIEKETGKLP